MPKSPIDPSSAGDLNDDLAADLTAASASAASAPRLDVKPGFVEYPDSPFQLYQPYPPAGDQPAAIDGLTQGVEDGLMSVSYTHLTLPTILLV